MFSTRANSTVVYPVEARRADRRGGRGGNVLRIRPAERRCRRECHVSRHCGERRQSLPSGVTGPRDLAPLARAACFWRSVRIRLHIACEAAGILRIWWVFIYSMGKYSCVKNVTGPMPGWLKRVQNRFSPCVARCRSRALRHSVPAARFAVDAVFGGRVFGRLHKTRYWQAGDCGGVSASDKGQLMSEAIRPHPASICRAIK